MIKVGLTGGYATGKSFVAKELETLGCYVVYADKLGHRVLERDGSAYAAVVKAFGGAILSGDGSIDRKKLGAIVFAAPDLLKRLTEIVHPAVFQLEEQAFAAFALRSAHGIAAIEAAILIETGRYKHFDKLIVTTCGTETQIVRGMRRDHLSREEVLERLSRQMPVAEKIRLADYVIDTDGEEEATAAQVREMYAELRQLAEASSS